jgi:hypothetical protein
MGEEEPVEVEATAPPPSDLVEPPIQSSEDIFPPHSQSERVGLTETRGPDAAAVEIGETAVDSTSNQIPVTDGKSGGSENTQWDYDKASTVGIAAHNRAQQEALVNGGYDSFARNENVIKVQEKLDRPDGLDGESGVIEASKNLALREDRLTQAADKNTALRFRHLVELGREDLEEAKASAREQAIRFIERARQERESNTEALQRPFEKLYDLHPEEFVKMPTTEFMALADEYSGLRYRLAEAQKRLPTIEEYATFLDNCLETKDVPGWALVSEMTDFVSNAANVPYKEVVNKFDAEAEDSFDKTPRQVIEGYKRIVDEYLETAKTRLAEAELAHQVFLSKYQKKATETTPEAVTEA